MADVLDLADSIADAIGDSWSPGVGDTCERVYRFTLNLEEMTGRYVYVLPSAYGFPEPLTRSQDTEELTVSVVVAERYTDPGPVPTEWVDVRVDFVETHVIGLDDSRAPDLPGGFYAWSSEVNPVYDLEELNQRNLFLSVVNLTFRRST